MPNKLELNKVTSKLLLDIAFELGNAMSSKNSNEKNYQILINILGERLNWDYGEVWCINYIEKTIQKSEITYLNQNCDELRVLKDERENIKWDFYEGIPGISQSEKKAFWISNFENIEFLHKKNLVLELGINTGIAIPIYSEEHIFAIIFFMSRAMKYADENQIDLYNLIAGRLGTLLLKIDIEREMLQAKEELKSSIDLNFSTLNKILRYRDPYTVDHQKKVTEIAIGIAMKMGYRGENIEDLALAAQLHDIGKLAIPLEILNKPGEIIKEEYALIKTHVETSYDLISTLPCRNQVKRLIYEHHEREDGSGYPRGLKSDEISPLSKILIIADVISAMLEDRPYRKGHNRETVMGVLLKGRTVIFDSSCVDIAIKSLLE